MRSWYAVGILLPEIPPVERSLNTFFLVPSVLAWLIFPSIYFLRLFMPLSRRRFHIGIALFDTIRDDSTQHAKTLRFTVRNRLAALTQQHTNIDQLEIDIIELNHVVGIGTSQRKRRLIQLCRNYGLHQLIGGNLRVEQNPQASVIQPVIYTRLIDPSQYGPPAFWQRETRATGWTIETEEQETEQLAEFALYVLAVANVSRYRFDAALRFLHAMNNRDAMALFFVRVCHAMRQESTEAMQTFDEVLTIDQNFFAAAAFWLVVREQTWGSDYRYICTRYFNTPDQTYLSR